MSEYTQGISMDGAAILKDGETLTIEEILDGLRTGEEAKQALSELKASLPKVLVGAVNGYHSELIAATRFIFHSHLEGVKAVYLGKLERDNSAWVSVDEYSKKLKDGQLCWVLFPCDSIKLCRLNDYKQYGGAVDFWQDLQGNDLFMNMTKFIILDQPLPPTQND
jgi:hypothetical protein